MQLNMRDITEYYHKLPAYVILDVSRPLYNVIEETNIQDFAKLHLPILIENLMICDTLDYISDYIDDGVLCDSQLSDCEKDRIYSAVVSFCLDVAEIIFNSQLYYVLNNTQYFLYWLFETHGTLLYFRKMTKDEFDQYVCEENH